MSNTLQTFVFQLKQFAKNKQTNKTHGYLDTES